MLRHQGYEGTLTVTDDLDRALDGADFVLIQIRVGGQEARLSDETVPLPCGCIGQETTGAGGLGKALRTVPVVLGIAERVRELSAADAWIIDFTNPAGIVTRALLGAGHRALGLCNVAIGVQRRIAGLLGVDPERVLVDQVGLNHLSWARFLRVDGKDVLPELLADHGDELAQEAGVSRRLLDELGVLPSYYLHYYYDHDRVLAEQLESVPRAATVAEIERGLIQHVTAYEQLALEAALSGDPVIVRKALLAHPLIGQEALSDELADWLLEAGATHLPQFPAPEGVA